MDGVEIAKQILILRRRSAFEWHGLYNELVVFRKPGREWSETPDSINRLRILLIETSSRTNVIRVARTPRLVRNQLLAEVGVRCKAMRNVQVRRITAIVVEKCPLRKAFWRAVCKELFGMMYGVSFVDFAEWEIQWMGSELISFDKFAWQCIIMILAWQTAGHMYISFAFLVL